MNRIDSRFQKCKAENRKALILYITAGDPSPDFTRKLIPVLIEAGADIIEVGVPFSDPMADGPTIQGAADRALAAGMTLQDVISICGELRPRHPEIPFVLFSYYNPILQYGTEKLVDESARLGIDGWLLVDVPPEEEMEVIPGLEKNGLAKITLLAPNTPQERISSILKNAKGFVYYITVTGVTGARTELPPDLAGHLAEVRRLSPAPVAAGFGVSTPAQARTVAEHADGVIVGSRLINIIQEAGSEKKALTDAGEFVEGLAKAVR